MGKGSTKNEQKANPQRVLQAKAAELEARALLSKLTTLRVGQRPPDYDSLVSAAKGMLNKARGKQSRSENDTQSGKRGRR
jgi:hypothetical protein